MRKHLFAVLAGLILACSSGNALAKSVLTSVTIGTQSPSPINPGATAAYPITVTRTGAGRLNIDFSCSNLPPGATASFSATPFVFKGNSPSSGTATLAISTTASIPQGTYIFSVTARDSRNRNIVTNTGTLNIGTDDKTSLSPQTITSINVQPNGSAGVSLKAAASKSYILQATTSLNPTSWSNIATNTTDATGICVFMDLDAGNYSTRFYRTAVAN